MSERNSLTKIDLAIVTGGEDAAGSIDLKSALAAVLGGGDTAGSIDLKLALAAVLGGEVAGSIM